MTLKVITPEQVRNKTVLLKVDYNVPLKKIGEKIVVAEDTRIQITVPTIQMLLKNNCKVIIVSHAGRPKGKVDENLRLKPMAEHLEHLLGQAVISCKALTGEMAKQAVSRLQKREVLILENTRFDPRESKNDNSLAQELASFADIFVNESFSTTHRKHASVAGVAQLLPAFAGPAMEQEYHVLQKLLQNPKHPFVSIVGGAKISGKIEAIRNLTKISDVVLVGGGVANNFIKAQGIDICNSYLEDCAPTEKSTNGANFVEVALDLMNTNKIEKMLLNGYIPLPKIIYPSDVIAATAMNNPKSKRVVSLTSETEEGLSKDLMFLDIGPKTQRLYRDIILQAHTVFWNGPMGVFEQTGFAEGTHAVASAVAKTSAVTTIGGGDTINAVQHFSLQGRFDNVSASGGAALEFLTGKKLPGLEPLLA
ncbi:MAG: phosphoglycerate kinase [Candidatus Pacebacteria bacterium]|nr:phosphoglycerate kinase [Candidatus Paceibacterota bacterium]PIR60588.1 MAG: phosphoglycerate kinase [Candidatus Pacebacteria bacterium CG10_big_fil_rev_8_21_14_0_10_44_54]